MCKRVLIFLKESMKRLLNYFSKFEVLLWGSSLLLICISFIIFDRSNYLSLIASIIGITSLIFSAKGNPIGQMLMIIFSLLYGIISYSFSYYGEMITYLGMTLPMAIIALISWLKNPYKGKKLEVKINSLNKKEYIFISGLTLIVTIIFYFILEVFNTTNIVPSTISVTTSFIAVYLTFRRSPYFALAYATNDIVLIILWVLASIENHTYIPVVFCFIVFLFNDLYGFINWQKMKEKQME